MIDILYLIFKLFLAILPFVLLCIRSSSVNLDESDRSKQFIMPVVAVLYSLVAMFLMKELNEFLIGIINGIPEIIENFAKSFEEEKAKSIMEFAAEVRDYLNGINLKFWMFYISNAIIIGVYLAIKSFLLAIIKRTLENGSDLHSKVAGWFYEYFPEKSKWCIREDYVEARSWLKFFYITATVLSVVLMLISKPFYENALIATVFYPVFGIIIVGELFFYLDGLTKSEYVSDILGEDEDSYKTVNYTLLRKRLRSLFGDKLLTENTSINNTTYSNMTTEELIREIEKDEDGMVDNFASYIKMLNAKGVDIDHNYVMSSLDLLKGKSILFNNPFYHDLIPYAFYPMNRALLRHKKVLVVLGRHAISEDIKTWLEDGIEAVTNIPFMWNIKVLGTDEEDTENIDIGIITRSDVLNIKLHNANSGFLEKVGFVVVIEPSKLISTAQIGLNLIVKQCCKENNENITYCLCDKNCDGLVDAMSHVLMTSITEVSATKKHMGTSSYMCWEPDGDYLHHRMLPNISRYLGVGTELSFAALKNQVSKTQWYGGETFPVVDMRWIDKQYYFDLMKYAGLPTNQEAMDECFKTSSNFWSAKMAKHNYFTVEDESDNMFEIFRNFATRSKEQGFINVISQSYMLKDYMAYNADIFETDAKAIPCIVADYVRTGRNTVLRLVLMMSTFPVPIETLTKELALMGIKTYELKKQIWYEIYRCYADVEALSNLPDDYKEAVEAASGLCLSRFIEKGVKIGIELLNEKDVYNAKLGRVEHTYYISNQEFMDTCVYELKSAGYITEDEKGDENYLGSELSGHIYQKYLPGQFFTFSGKYYEMRYLTADNHVLVRRAADHITDRPSYRQIREYVITGSKLSEGIGSCQDVSGMKVIHEYADIKVNTPGYYKMSKYEDFETGKEVLFEGEKSGIPQRRYYNKEILRIDLPDADGKFSDSVRYTITTLINELFKTIFAENCHYIVAVTDESFAGEKKHRPLTYSIDAEGAVLNKNSIYIIEDSQLDLGLMVAVERNWQRILGIITDYLKWHMDTLELSLNPPAEPEPPVKFVSPEEEEKEEAGEGKPKKKGIIGRFIDRIKNLFRRKKKKKEETEEVPEEDLIQVVPGEEAAEKEIPEEETPAEIPSEAPSAEDAEEAPSEDAADTEKAEEKPKKKGIIGRFIDKIKNLFRRKKKKKEEKNPEEPTEEAPTEEGPSEEAPAEEAPTEEVPSEEAPAEEAPAEEIPEAEEPSLVEAPDGIEYVTEDEKVIEKGIDFRRKEYHNRYYLLFGGKEAPENISVRETFEYLKGIGLENNPLKQAREGKNIAEMIERTFKPGKADSRYCDFCGAEINGVEYDTLSDGRDRCTNCGKTAIKTGDEFRVIFEDVKRNLESFFGIKINVGIRVEMVNSKKLHKKIGKAFIPTNGADGRVLGVAIKDRSGYSLLVENGSPRMASMLTMAHELTHIWQYINWNDKNIIKKYGKELRLEVYEGMAKWAEIQYAYLINEPAVAKREELITAYRNDEYGRGFLRYMANYPFSLGTTVTKDTPFMHLDTPLRAEFCGEISYDPHLPAEEDDEDTPSGGSGEPGGIGGAKPIDLTGPSERVAGNVRYFAYETLNGDEKCAYDILLNAINSFLPEADMTQMKLNDEQIKRISKFIQIDHPEIFWFNFGAVYYFNESDRMVNRVELKYCMTKEEAEKRQSQIDEATGEFLGTITSGMSDYEVALRVYENIIKTVDYDTLGLDKQKAGEPDSTVPDDLRSIYGVFVNKKAVCAGYAKAMQYLMNTLGLECTYVTSATHAWNLLKLEGDYYHVDVTWGDFSDTMNEKNVSAEIGYDCFCITTAEALSLKEHEPDKELTLPECTATKCNYHRRSGLYFDSYDENAVRFKICESIANGSYSVSFKCADKAVYDRFIKELIIGGKVSDMLKYSNFKSENRVELSYRYSERTERLILSLEFNKA